MTISPAIIGIAEIVLNVRDLPRMRVFYQEVLGLKLLSQACYESGPEPDPDGEPTIAFLTIQQADTGGSRHQRILSVL
jgi:catechol-2,3-dioxygenase